MKNHNLCVRSMSFSRPNRGEGFLRCKTIPPVKTVKDAKKLAYRMMHRLDLPFNSTVMIKLAARPKKLPTYYGSGETEGRRYYFKQLHGKVDCRVGSEFGPKCSDE